MISVEEALSLVEQHVTAVPSQRVGLARAAGLVLADDVASDCNSPPHDKAMMDGFAIASGDQFRERRVVETVAAGDVPRHAVSPGIAIRIMTGAPLPDGADAVVPWEQVETLDDGRIRLPDFEIKAGTNVMPLGVSIRAGQIVVRRGKTLRPVEVAAIAEAGHLFVRAVPRPSVAVLPTGNELVPVGKAAEAGHIRNSNGPLLCAAVAAAGGEPIDFGIGRDDLDQLRQLISEGLKADMLLISGGVSAGDFDLVPHVLDDLGVRQVFHQVSVRPGKPLWFGVYEAHGRATPVFGLPGNPVSSFVCFTLFARRALAKLAGRDFESAPLIRARLTGDRPPAGQRASYLPARVLPGDEPRIELVAWHGSADLAALVEAHGLAVFPAADAARSAVDEVEVLLF